MNSFEAKKTLIEEEIILLVKPLLSRMKNARNIRSKGGTELKDGIKGQTY